MMEIPVLVRSLNLNLNLNLIYSNFVNRPRPALRKVAHIKMVKRKGFRACRRTKESRNVLSVHNQFSSYSVPLGKFLISLIRFAPIVE